MPKGTFRLQSDRWGHLLTPAGIALAACLACANAQAGPLQDGDLVLITAEPGDIPIGYLAYDVVFPGDFGEFDIVNQTGPNSDAGIDFPPDFPVTTTVQFSSLSLTVNFSDGSTQVFGPSFFTLNIDGESLDGTPIAVGGVSPQPVGATLTGDLTPTTITVGSPPVTETIDASLTAPTLGGPAVPAVPEPDMSLTLLVGSLMALIFARRRDRRRDSRTIASAAGLGGAIGALLAVAVFLFPAVSFAAASLHQNIAATPGSGVAGESFLSLTASGVPSGVSPSGAIPAGNVTIRLAPTCTASASSPVAGEADATAASVTKILGSSDRFNFEIPRTLLSGALTPSGTYMAQIVDTTDGFSGDNCSIVVVTGSTPTLNACVPTSSLGVVAGTNVVAYVPNAWWGSSSTGLTAVPIEGALVGTNTSIATAHAVNSCAGNPATGQVVCTANNTDVYLVGGSPPALTNTLTSGHTGFASFSGGECQNCGVAINALTNTAAINGGGNSSAGHGIQVLNLNTDVFQLVFNSTQNVSEDISIDPGRNLILSPNEQNNYPLFSLNSASGAITGEFDRAISTPGEPDSAAEDCSTGIALSSDEFESDVYAADLTQAILTAGTPGSWTSPSTLFTLSGTSGFSAGISGISVAQGSSHLAIVAGEFGGNTFGVLQLQSASGTGGSNPTLPDYVTGLMPNTPDGVGFSAGCDPHTTTAYTSPNTGKAIGLYASWTSLCVVPKWIGVIDLAKALAAPRAAGTHMIDQSATGNPTLSGIVTYVKVQ